jgi:hypothetical protein
MKMMKLCAVTLCHYTELNQIQLFDSLEKVIWREDVKYKCLLGKYNKFEINAFVFKQASSA